VGMTITEKILADHAGKDKVTPGEIVTAQLDAVLANDITGALAIKELSKMGYDSVFDTDKVIFVIDHFAPSPNIKAAQQTKLSRDFARKTGLKHFYDVGSMGIEHALLPEKGLVLPGNVVIGGDSHTCTYGGLGAFSTGVGSTDLAAGMALGKLWFKVPESIKFIYRGRLQEYVTGKDLILFTIGRIGVDGALYKAMEFAGETIEQLSMDERFTLCNMAIEAGAKNGIVPPDEKTREFVKDKDKANRKLKLFSSDEDAVYIEVYKFDVSNLEPQVAFPHSPENTRNVSDAKNVAIDQVVIGSCTNGRLEDLRLAARILEGRKVHSYVRALVIPATQSVFQQAMQEGLIDTFINAGFAVCTPTCGPCFGGHMGVLAEGERCVATTNRNFIGRMGHPESEVYLASPAVAAASAIIGKIASPWEVI
jgi:3-isopropylmalate/(R)-2-methylmalate dehydratase large subunit